MITNASDNNASRRLTKWIEESIKNEHFTTYNISLAGKPKKGQEGYLSDIVFAKVDGTTKDHVQKTLHLVVKQGKVDFKTLSKMVVAYATELLMYDNVFPAFKKFHSGKNIPSPINFIPKCYKVLVIDNMEILVLKNYKESGYEIYDNQIPLNVNHLKLVMIEYGKLHALSFALKEQRPEEFNALIPVNDFLKESGSNDVGRSNTRAATAELLVILEQKQEFEMIKKLKNILVEDIRKIFVKILTQEEPQSAISHGDGWINNFMFMYKDDAKTVPSQVKILDWQIAGYRSPVFDISYLLYANGSQAEFDRFEELLETYYASFSGFLRELGSNPDELFTYADLQRHWKKYSLFAVLLMPAVLRFVLGKKEDAPLDDLEAQVVEEYVCPDIVDVEVYYQRVKAIFAHYFKYAS